MKIVLTGGPSAGKTALVSNIQKEFGHRVCTVPEAASILFSGGFPRNGSKVRLRHQQRAIYFLQVELEALVQDENPGKLIVCDRGTIDGMAYWPGEPGEFLKSVKTTLKKELKRYNWVIHLESAQGTTYDKSNPVRIETVRQAQKVDNRIKRVWSKHPSRVVIHNAQLFSKKVERALEVVREILEIS